MENTDDSGGRADYILGRPAKAVLEAKREAKKWSLLPTGQPTNVRKLRPLLNNCKTFFEVVHQALPYCNLRGAPIGIVCNGPQLAIFQAITIGQEPLEGECYLFNGFESYVNSFLFFGHCCLQRELLKIERLGTLPAIGTHEYLQRLRRQYPSLTATATVIVYKMN